jgi:hypothetical protein
VKKRERETERDTPLGIFIVHIPTVLCFVFRSSEVVTQEKLDKSLKISRELEGELSTTPHSVGPWAWFKV